MLKKIKKEEKKKVDRENEREREFGGRDVVQMVVIRLQWSLNLPLLDFLFNWSWLMYMANY